MSPTPAPAGLPPRACGCPGAGVVPPDREDDHRRYHDLVEQQTGIPYGAVLNADTIRAARGLGGSVSSAPLAARNEQLGKSSPGWRRDAHHGRPPKTPADGRRERDEALARVDTAADPAWKDEARRIVRRVATTRDTFTTDDVWDAGLPTPTEPRALGPVITALIRAGAITATGDYVPSRRRHATPMPVYRLGPRG